MGNTAKKQVNPWRRHFPQKSNFLRTCNNFLTIHYSVQTTSSLSLFWGWRIKCNPSHPISLWYILILSSLSQLLFESGRFHSQGFDRNSAPVITLRKYFWKCVRTKTLIFHWHEFWSLTLRKEGRPFTGLFVSWMPRTKFVLLAKYY
jgi:hypothetical protein